MALRTTLGLAGAVLIVLATACEAETPRDAAPEPPTASGPRSVPVLIAGERFHLELAGDQATRMRGMGGRTRVDPSSGMLFAFSRPAPRAFLMRDCLIPLDIAYLDEAGRVVALHTMPVEPPRRPEETPLTYEERLPTYTSGAPAQFVIETGAGRLVGLGLGVGDIVEFDRAAVLRHTR